MIVTELFDSVSALTLLDERFEQVSKRFILKVLTYSGIATPTPRPICPDTGPDISTISQLC